MNVSSTQEAKYQTVGEVAETYRVGEETIRRWLREHKLAGTKLGKSWLIPIGAEPQEKQPSPSTGETG